MKKIILSLVSMLITFISVNSQTPEGFNYQAVIRDASGDPIANTTIGLQFNIRKESVLGSVVYSETISTNSNDLGLVTTVIGEGNSVDNFGIIDWGIDIYFLEVGLDVNNTSNYTI